MPIGMCAVVMCSADIEDKISKFLLCTTESMTLTSLTWDCMELNELSADLGVSEHSAAIKALHLGWGLLDREEASGDLAVCWCRLDRLDSQKKDKWTCNWELTPFEFSESKNWTHSFNTITKKSSFFQSMSPRKIFLFIKSHLCIISLKMR